MAEDQIEEINIRPKVTILSVLQHLNYQPWFALAEFVDNSIQSHHLRNADIRKVDGARAQLRVDVEIENGPDRRIVIRDNAGGIARHEFLRAFRPAELPPDTSSLAEFGMGMKSAACWFSPQWSVRTKAIGEEVERTVTFDITKIVADGVEKLPVASTWAPENRHYTEITLLNARKAVSGRTLGKVRDHLADIYRRFLRERALRLFVGGKEVLYEEPKVLVAPAFRGAEDGEEPPSRISRIFFFPSQNCLSGRSDLSKRLPSARGFMGPSLLANSATTARRP